jgi:hypothetical protein
MKRALALLSLAWLSACFPDYDVVPTGLGSGGTGNTGAGGSGNSSAGGSGGTGAPVEPTCEDGNKNGEETGPDCGMTACGIGCDPGEGCIGDVDCKVGLCARMVCQAASCSDKLFNGNETDLDCGGDMGCDRCTVGQRCKLASDCDGGACVSGQCKAPTCKDEILNADETDKDCGGSCAAKCGVGQGCQTLDDCDALICSKNKCQPAVCDDGLLNQDESAKDCGGSCSPCPDGATCSVGTDCESGVCGGNKHCSTATCIDGVKNGKEPTKDCGIDCPTKCALLDACNVANDCGSMLTCTDNRCIPSMAQNKLLSPLNWIPSSSTKSDNSKDSYLIDGNNQNTYWISGKDQTAGIWLKLDMRTTQVVFSVEIDCTDAGSCNDLDPSKNDLAAGINNAFSDVDTDEAWAAVEPVLKGYAPKPNEVIQLPKPGVGRYMRIILSQGKQRWWRVDELWLRN